MKRMYKIAVFDVDGTLLDTTEGVLSSVKYTIERYGLQRISDKEMRSFIGPPIQDSFRRFYGIDVDLSEKYAAVFRKHYKEVDLYKAVPYTGIYDVCAALMKMGVKIAIATYKRQDYAEDILHYFSFHKYSDIICGADYDNRLKKVDIIRNSIELIEDADYSQVLMIGDSHHDAIGAEQLGIDFLGVTYGFGFKGKSDVYQYKAIGSVDLAKDILNYFD